MLLSIGQQPRSTKAVHSHDLPDAVIVFKLLPLLDLHSVLALASTDRFWREQFQAEVVWSQLRSRLFRLSAAEAEAAINVRAVEHIRDIQGRRYFELLPMVLSNGVRPTCPCGVAPFRVRGERLPRGEQLPAQLAEEFENIERGFNEVGSCMRPSRRCC